MSMFNSLTNDFNEIFNFAMAKPTVSIVEHVENASEILVQVPGHNGTTLDIDVTADTIHVTSIKEKMPRGAAVVDQKFQFGLDHYDGNAISAACNNGLLIIRVPLRKQKLGGKVTIG